jgi:hypothetical protein
LRVQKRWSVTVELKDGRQVLEGGEFCEPNHNEMEPHGTTSVCTGALILGAAGILKGFRATTHWYVRDLLTKFGAQYVSERVVRQGKIITAASVSSGIDMALRLAQEASGAEMAQTIQLIIEYDPKPPFDSGSIAKADSSIVEFAKRAVESAFK